MPPVAPTTCADVEPILNQIWREFRSEGITDDLAIIEHLAFLLLCWHAKIWNAVSEKLTASRRSGLGNRNAQRNPNQPRASNLATG